MAGAIDFAFVHGGGQGGWVWDDTIAAMRRQDDGALGRLLSLDAPGCGAKRGRSTDDLAMADIAAELVDDIVRAGLDRVVLVGHSQAGQALPAMARLRPGLFRRLVHVTCSAPLPGQTLLAMIGNGLHGSDPAEVGWPIDPAACTITDRLAAQFCSDMTPDAATAFLARLGRDAWPVRTYSESDWRYDDCGNIPASYVVCLRDNALPAPWQMVFAQRLAAKRLIRLDAGHQAMNTRPYALGEILRVEAMAGETG